MTTGTRAALRAGARRLRALLLLAAAGCAALPWPQLAVPRGAAPSGDGWLDLRGVVHVHTRDSHDSPGRIADVVGGARKAGVAWVALTEHTRPGGPPNAGRFDGVWIIPGYELRAWGGSLLALGIDALPRYRDPEEAVRAVHAAGGLAFVGHLDSSRVTAADWRVARPDGLELANLHANAIEAGFARLAAEALVLPAPWLLRGLLRLPQANLELWQTLPAADPIVGGVDAHAKLRLLGPLGGTVDSYARLFRLLTTHVWVKTADPPAILEALRAGRSYVAFEGRGRVDAFRFEREGDGFELAAPRRARLVLTCDGAHQERDGIAAAHFAVPPGAERCRGEAWLGDQPWIITSYRRIRQSPDD